MRFDCAKCRESERMIAKVLLLLTKPYPRDLPVCRSVITTASSMSPKASKYFLSEASFVWYGSPPTKILVKVVSFWSAVGCMTSRAPFIYWWRSIGSAGDRYLARGRLRGVNRVPASEKPSPVSLCSTRVSPTLFIVFSKLQQPDDIHDSAWTHVETASCFAAERNRAGTIYSAVTRATPPSAASQSAYSLGVGLGSAHSHWFPPSSFPGAVLHLLLSFTNTKKKPHTTAKSALQNPTWFCNEEVKDSASFLKHLTQSLKAVV